MTEPRPVVAPCSDQSGHPVFQRNMVDLDVLELGSMSMELAIRTDLEAIPDDVAFRATLVQSLIFMARAYDNIPASADPAKIARLNQEIRQTIRQLRDGVAGDDNDDSEYLSTPVVSAPVRDAAQPGPAHPGANGGGGRPPAG